MWASIKESIAIGFIITVIGMLSYYAYKATDRNPTKTSNYWGMILSTFLVGTGASLVGQYTGAHTAYCRGRVTTAS